MSRPPVAPPPSQRRELLFAGLGVSVFDFRCNAHVEREGAEEPNPSHGIVLVRRGVFGRRRSGDALLADANHVLFFNAGEPYRYSHPLPGGDECTILSLDGARALELLERWAPAQAEDRDRPFALGHALSSPRAARLQYELLGLVRRGAAALSIEDALAELADEAVRTAYAESGARETGSPAVRRRRRELVEAAQLAIHGRLESPPGLGELARQAGCSPFHLSRTFRATTGVSLRRYTARLRARAAAERLAGRDWDLTRLALDLGYADHSHFTNAFRTEWGVPPSRFRAMRRAPA
jgi:AraC-like DNA-binding protein